MCQIPIKLHIFVAMQQLDVTKVFHGVMQSWKPKLLKYEDGAVISKPQQIIV